MAAVSRTTSGGAVTTAMMELERKMAGGGGGGGRIDYSAGSADFKQPLKRRDSVGTGTASPNKVKMVAVVDKVKKLNKLARGSSPLVSGGVTDDEYSKNTLTQRRKSVVTNEDIAHAETASTSEAESVWKALIDEAVPSADNQSTFVFRGKTYKLQSRQEQSGKVSVISEDGQDVLWKGFLTGSLLDADKRLRAKLKQQSFLQTQPKGSDEKATLPLRCPTIANGQSDADEELVMAKTSSVRPLRAAPSPVQPSQATTTAAVSEDRTLDLQWEQLLKREGFDESFQNAILERVQTPRRGSRPIEGIPVPAMPAIPSPGQSLRRDFNFDSPISPKVGHEGGGVFANVEEVPPHLRGMAVNLLSAGEYYDPNFTSVASSTMDNYTSASSWTELGRTAERRPEICSNVDVSRHIIVSDFTTAQGVLLKTGAIVSLVRQGQRGWILVRDVQGIKSWVPQANLKQESACFQTDTFEGGDGKIVNGDGRYELMKAAPVLQEPFARDLHLPQHVRQKPSRSAPPAEDVKVNTINESNDKSSLSMEHEMFEPWMTEGVEARPQQSLGTTSLVTHPGPSGMMVSRTQGDSFHSSLERCEYSSDMQGLEEAATALEQTIGTLMKAVKYQKFNQHMWQEDLSRQRQSLGRHVDQLHGMADVNMLVKLEQEIFKEREEQEKERYTWSVERKQLEMAIELHQRQVIDKNFRLSTEGGWRDERRQLLQDLQSERERASWLENRLLMSRDHAEESIQGSSSVQELLSENQRLQLSLEKMSVQMTSDKTRYHQQLQQQQQALNHLQETLESAGRIKNCASLQDEKEKSALRQGIRDLQDQLADRDVALATIAHGQQRKMAADQKDMDGLMKDLQNLGQLAARNVDSDTMATIQSLHQREAKLVLQNKELESTVSILQQRTLHLQTMLQAQQNNGAGTLSPKTMNDGIDPWAGINGHEGHGARSLAEFEVENATLKQALQEQVIKLEQAEIALESQRQLVVSHAVLQNKYTTLLRQSSALRSKLDD